jgi:hypothetical protein
MLTANFLVLAQVAVATPLPTPSRPPAPLSGGFGQKAPSSGKAKVVITDGTLAPTGRGGTMSVSGTRSAPPVGTPAAGTAAAPTAATDDEASWRGRATSLRASLAAAEDDLGRAEAMNPVIMGGRPGYMVEVGASARNAALSPYRVRLMQLRGELAGLPEECRRTSGCQPGWVR